MTDRAVDRLEGGLAGIMADHRETLVRRSLEADYRKSRDPEEPPRHFIDLEEYDPEVMGPSWDHDHLVDRYGKESVDRWGIVPWAAEEVFLRLVEAFRQGERERILSLSADLSHYVADLHQPLHTTRNYDGQLTGQRGIHARFETKLLDRHLDEIRFVKEGPGDLGPVLPALHRFVRESFGQVEALLKADRQAVDELPAELKDLLGDADEYPDAYYEAMFSSLGPMLEERLNLASQRLASLWWMAWREAGEPEF